jgi:hypothetical protein
MKTIDKFHKLEKQITDHQLSFKFNTNGFDNHYYPFYSTENTKYIVYEIKDDELTVMDKDEVVLHLSYNDLNEYTLAQLLIEHFGK